jgi:4-amino-4-deoxy-L-arabinose transferase-like glycosyltransferase
LLALAALLPRVLDLGQFVTLDEVNFWYPRSEQFLEALQAGQFGEVPLKPHPGVTTMWLGSVGILLRRVLLIDLDLAVPYPLLVTLMRLPAALVHTAAILVGYALLRRMFPAALALLAALLWATDPFMIGYSRVLHLDALAASFATLCLLAAAAYWHHTRHPGLLVLSAVCGALAVLSKSPALAVLPLVAGTGLWVMGYGSGVRGYRLGAIGKGSESITHHPSPITHHPSPITHHPSPITHHLWPLLAWGLVFALTIVAAWPVAWDNPLHTVELLRGSLEEEGLQPHAWGNYFMGQPVEVPGPLFYPVSLALRTTPLTLAGVLLLPLVWRQAREMPAARRSLLLLAAFVVFFVLAMSVFPKQFNRYLVPVFPAFDILAAAGLWWTITALARGRAYLQRALLLGVALAAWLNAAWWHPYSIAAFNQALGGTRAGAYAFPIGWGEGLGQAAAWLNEQPDITGVRVASSMINSFQPYLKHGARAFTPGGPTLPPDTGYALVYVRDVQRGNVGPPFDQFYPQATPLHTVTIHGVDYAWIYQVPPPVEHQLDVTFGERITLRGYTLHTDALSSTGTLSLTVQWQAQAPPQHDYMLFAHLLNAQGERVAQIDARPAGPDALPTSWAPPRVHTWTHPLPVPPDLPPGDYWLALGLYKPDDFTRLPLRGAAPPPAAPDAGPEALLRPVALP